MKIGLEDLAEDHMNEVLALVSEAAVYYAGCDSTSVTYERAQMLMEGVLYCLNEYRQSAPNGLVCNEISVREQYQIGRKLVLDKAYEVRQMYEELADSFDDYGVECLGDTVKKGIPEFLKWYDAKFFPQETILTLDYPLIIDFRSQCGVDAVHTYLRAVKKEQEFLGIFERNHVISVLKMAVPSYELMVENVCGILLVNTIGHIAVGKPIYENGFQTKVYEELYAVFSSDSVDEIEHKVRKIIESMVEQLCIGDRELEEYLCAESRNIAVRIRLAAGTGQL